MNKKLNWRLPTENELVIMWNNLHYHGIGNFSEAPYWSSLDYEHDITFAWFFLKGLDYLSRKVSTLCVRAVSSFSKNKANKHYKVGQTYSEGIVFDIQDNTIFVCKPEDEESIYWHGGVKKTFSWYDAKKIIKNKEIYEKECAYKIRKQLLVSKIIDYIPC